MSQIFKEDGKVIPVTIIEVSPCLITQIKTDDKDGYQAVQIGFQKIEKVKKIKKTMKEKPFHRLKEIRINEQAIETKKVGDSVDVSIFDEGDVVKISGISKGKGFQGVVKRWGFSGRNATHGARHEQRELGSIGGRFPQRVIKGKKMPGRMGSDRITIRNLKIVKIDKENNLLAVKGAVPGRKGTLLEIRG